MYHKAHYQRLILVLILLLLNHFNFQIRCPSTISRANAWGTVRLAIQIIYQIIIPSKFPWLFAIVSSGMFLVFKSCRKWSRGDFKNIKSGVLIRSNIVLTAASILFDSQNRRYRHTDIKVTVNLHQADEQVRMAKVGIHHRKFNFHHGRNNIGMIVLRKPFQFVPGLNITCTSPQGPWVRVRRTACHVPLWDGPIYLCFPFAIVTSFER